MKAWTSLTDTSVVKTYRKVPALRNDAFREFVRFLNLLSHNKFAGIQKSNPACENVVTFVALLNHPSLRFSGRSGLCCAPTVFVWASAGNPGRSFVTSVSHGWSACIHAGGFP
jgi:hypothetical protein